MPRILYIFAILLTIPASSQSLVLSLPMDNGSTVSFAGSMRMVIEDPRPIECLAHSIFETKKVMRSRMSVYQGWMECELSFPIKGHSISCLTEIMTDSDTVKYSFSCYRVDDVPISTWLELHPGALSERIKSTVFVETVMMIVQIRKAADA